MASVQQNSFKAPSMRSSMRNRNQKPFLPSSNYKKCVEVYQQGYGITTSEKPFISTFGLSCCIGIVGYCKEIHKAFIIHADSIKLISNNIGNFYYHLNKASFQSSERPKMYDMYLFGGNYDESSEDLLNHQRRI